MSFILRKIAEIKNDICHQFFLLAWGGWVMPRSIRRLIAGSQIHRAWFLGYNGYFEEDGVAYGLARPYGEIMEARHHEDVKSWREASGEDKKLAYQNYFEQWDEYSDLTDMPDFAREIQCRKDAEKALDNKRWQESNRIIAQADADIWRLYNE